MSTYRASVHVDDGMLHTSRPLTAPEPVGDMIDSVVYDMSKPDGPATAGVLSVEVVVETAGRSDTPTGDSIAARSSQPLPSEPEQLQPDDPPGPPVDVEQRPAAAPVPQ